MVGKISFAKDYIKQHNCMTVGNGFYVPRQFLMAVIDAYH